MAKYQRKPDGIHYHPAFGRIMEHKGNTLRIYWSTAMLDYLRRHYPTTLNEELAGCIGVSQRTMIRKARELGLKKDSQWLSHIWEERRRLANIISKSKGYPGRFKKGERANPDGEFKKGRKPSQEEITKRIEQMKKWYSRHPIEAKQKAYKAWQTRRANQQITK